jgi:hypothetical protein
MLRQNIARDEFFVGTDHEFPVTVLNRAQTEAVDITGYALSYIIKKQRFAADALVTKTTAGGGIVISGTFNSDPLVNTQVATVVIQDTDTDGLPAGPDWYELKRADAGFEGVIVQGTLPLEASLHRS